MASKQSELSPEALRLVMAVSKEKVGGRLGTSATDFESGKWVGIPVKPDKCFEK